jgi:hypothetical protein
MNPQIKRYLDEHGATYTPEALRKGLLDAGYDPAEVDGALREWSASATAMPESQDRRTFRVWAVRFHVAALIGMVVLLIALRGTQAAGTAGIAAVVLSIALLIGWAISSLIGRALLPRTGPLVALVVPAISALVLGGSCLALMVGSLSPPPHRGSVHLTLAAPVTFDGTGSADCYLLDAGAVQVNGGQLGSLNGRLVSVFVTWYGEGAAAPEPGVEVAVNLDARSDTEPPESYSVYPGTTVHVGGATQAHSGTIDFEGLSREPTEPAPAGDLPDTISGSVGWTCE